MTKCFEFRQSTELQTHAQNFLQGRSQQKKPQTILKYRKKPEKVDPLTHKLSVIFMTWPSTIAWLSYKRALYNIKSKLYLFTNLFVILTFTSLEPNKATTAQEERKRSNNPGTLQHNTHHSVKGRFMTLPN